MPPSQAIGLRPRADQAPKSAAPPESPTRKARRMSVNEYTDEPMTIASARFQRTRQIIAAAPEQAKDARARRRTAGEMGAAGSVGGRSTSTRSSSLGVRRH